MNFDAVIFDMDGVIVDTHASVTAFWEALAAEEGVHITPEQYARDIYGCQAVHTLDAVFPAVVGERRRQVLENIHVYEDNLVYTPVPGVTGFLAALKQQRIPTALATSGAVAKVQAALGQLQLLDCFDIIITAEDVAQGKPDPACYLLAANRLGVAPGRCLIFEDSIAGVRAAVSAGAHCIGVATTLAPERLHAVGAAEVVADFRAVSLSTGAPDAGAQPAPGHSLPLAHARLFLAAAIA